MEYIKRFFLCLFLCMFSQGIVLAQKRIPQFQVDKVLVDSLSAYFERYECSDFDAIGPIKIIDILVDSTNKQFRLFLNEIFGYQPFREETVRQVYDEVRLILPKQYEDYQLTIYTVDYPIEELVPFPQNFKQATEREYKSIPNTMPRWIKDLSRPYPIKHGMDGRHLCVWASHGKYYHCGKNEWMWQRPHLYCTTEDMFTQSFVIPYIIPMLQNAGAIVYTPRERDWQKNEIIVDNDLPEKGGSYQEFNEKYEWKDAGEGFAHLRTVYMDGQNPFTEGTCRVIETTSNKRQSSSILWTPQIQQEGDYAVYVSYKTLPNSVRDAVYYVKHQGVTTKFMVNQQMGGGTWVYLGTFHFTSGDERNNHISLTNLSDENGVITADAIRLGGGMGNIARCDSTQTVGVVSGLPRFLEASRYYSQWAGNNDTIYSFWMDDDYSDDIRVRANTENILARGSYYHPGDSGNNVPIELSLAVHSDAGYARDDSTIIGTLGIYTSDFNEGLTGAKLSRLTSRDLNDLVLTQIESDLKGVIGTWHRRMIYDRNYGETRVPEFPAMILEMLSHQNFTDMKLAHDPVFKFYFSRAVYKGILKYLAKVHGEKECVTQPLPVHRLSAEVNTEKKMATLKWDPTLDLQDATAAPTRYIIYMAVGDDGFDNGTVVSARDNSFELELKQGTLYRFRVAAMNDGGCSMLSDEVCCMLAGEQAPSILLVDGFQRVAGPQPVFNDSICGFDMKKEPGVIDNKMPGYCGYQLYFMTDGYGKETEQGTGYSGSELEGMILAGNTHDYCTRHALDILGGIRVMAENLSPTGVTGGLYNISSCTIDALPSLNINSYKVMDVILGAQKEDGYSIRKYKSITPATRECLTAYTRQGGSILFSGAFVGSDMANAEEQEFTSSVLKYKLYEAQDVDSIGCIRGLDTELKLYDQPNEEHYWIRSVDALEATNGAFCMMLYDGKNYCAATAYQGTDYRCMTFGFPLECITDTDRRHDLWNKCLDFLLYKY